MAEEKKKEESITNGIHHAGLTCVRLDRNDILEAVQGDHSNARWPDVHNLLHLLAYLQTTTLQIYIKNVLLIKIV